MQNQTLQAAGRLGMDIAKIPAKGLELVLTSLFTFPTFLRRGREWTEKNEDNIDKVIEEGYDGKFCSRVYDLFTEFVSYPLCWMAGCVNALVVPITGIATMMGHPPSKDSSEVYSLVALSTNIASGVYETIRAYKKRLQEENGSNGTLKIQL